MQRLLIVLHVVSGLYAGACLSIAVVDLRYIVSITNNNELLTTFPPLLQNMGMLMAPQLIVLLVLCLLFSFKAFKAKQSVKAHTPLVILIAILVITLGIHIPINLAVISGALPDEALLQAVRSWDTWHWARTALAIALPVAVMKSYKPLAK